MSKQDIQQFSIDEATQEEKDFLVYMYGDDLERVINKRPKEISWWVKAFQAVKDGKRPKFNWAAFFLALAWGVRKKGFKLLMELSFGFLIGEAAVLYFNPNSKVQIGMLFGLTLALIGPKYIIDEYVKNKQLNTVHVNGRTPFVHVFLILLLSLIMTIPASYLSYLNMISAWCWPVFSWVPIIIYTFALMKFWLPAKQN